MDDSVQEMVNKLNSVVNELMYLATGTLNASDSNTNYKLTTGTLNASVLSEKVMKKNVSERANYWKVKEVKAVIDFIKECCHLNINAEVKTKDLYDHYISWCENTGNNFCMVGKNKFITIVNTTLNTNGQVIRSYRTNEHRGWLGIGINFSNRSTESA